ncbi:MAG: fibronectin type III domain-containing protein, partial [Bacteroidales bacterium]|nr:fibronectin type III domain-containing protein [Bacteroidales bacterium]
MKKFINLIAFAALLFAPALAAAQDDLTVADGTTTNSYVPIYGTWADADQHNQVIYPADSIEDMLGGTISGMTFYMSSPNSQAWNITVTISLGTTAASDLSAGLDASTSLTQVWQGTVNGQTGEMSFEFDEEFVYDGDNLLLDIQTVTSGTYNAASFYGVSLTGASRYSYNSTTSSQNFLPKTKFEYTPGGSTICRKPKSMVFSNITNNGADISWTAPVDGASEYAVFIDGAYETSVYDTFYTASGLTANSNHLVQVKNVCGEGDSSGFLGGTFRTLCELGNCEVTLQVSSYSYAGSVNVMQNGGSIANVSFSYSSGNSQSVEICNGDSLVMIYTAPSYSYSTTTWTVVDAGNSPIATFTNSAATGDTVLAVANGCPSCMPVANLMVSDADTDYFTVSWTGPDNAQGYIVLLDSVEVSDYDGTSTEYTVSGLTNSDRHLIQVCVDCGDEDSSAWRSINASATCTRSHISADDEAEFLETLVGLDGTFGGTVSASADHTASNALLPCWYFSNNYVWLKNQEITFESGHADAYLCLPIMDAPINTLEITWTGKIGNVGDSPDSVVLGIADASGENVTWLDTIFYSGQSRAAWVDHPWYALDQYGYEGSGSRIAFKVLFSSNWNAFKNFHVRQIPQCTAPTNLVGHNYTNADSTYFTWTPQGSAEEWQVALGTPEDDVDGLSYTTVTEPTYVIPASSLTLGEQYTFWVRANCEEAQSEWKSHTFYSGTAIMPASGTDTVSGCNLVVYDNGYNNPYPSNYHNSTIVVRPSQPGQLVGISGGWFTNYCYQGSCQGSLTVYDGEGTNGTVLLTMDSRDTINDTILGEEGAITIRLSGGQYAGDGLEIFTFCTDAPTCLRPKHLTATVSDEGTVSLSWDNANATDYIIYYKVDSANAEWQSVTAAGLAPDTTTYTFDEGTLEPATRYIVKVAGDCGEGDVSLQSTETSFRTPCEGESCQVSVSFSYSYSYTNYELIQNGYTFGQTSSARTYDVCSGMPLTLRTQADSYYDDDIVVTNTADIELFRGGIDIAYDTVIATPCPSCLPAIGIHTDSVTATEATISWSAMGSNTDWIVYLNGEEAGSVSDTAYTFTGLVANTVYTAGIRAFCGDGDTSVMRTIEFRTACEGGNCTFSVVMSDSYGDGWNGNAVDVYSAGSLFASATIAAGSSNTETFSPCLGDSVVLVWQGGSYADETSFSIVDASDSTLLSISNASGSTTACSAGDTLVVFDGQCAATVVFVPDTNQPGPQPGGCDAPTNLSATATDSTITITFFSTAGLYEVGIVEGSTWDEATADIDDEVYNNTYTFTGLNASTEYTVAVRAVCDDDWDYIYSDWATATVSTTGGSTPQPAECLAPTDVHTVSVDSNRAVITWTAGGDETAWQIKVNDDGQNLIDASTTTYVMSNLTPATQ